MIKAGRLGHLVLNVSDLKGSIAFYNRVVGLEVVIEDVERRIAFLSLGEQHHDIALVERATGDKPAANQPGLVHMAWRLENFSELQHAHAELGENLLSGTELPGATIDQHQIWPGAVGTLGIFL